VTFVEVPQPGEGLIDGATGEVAPVRGLEVDEEVEDVVRGELGRVDVGVVAP
jgi:hypothetical protein